MICGSLSRDEREWDAGGMPPSAHEAVAAEPKSFTGQYLKPLLERTVRQSQAEGAAPDSDPGSVEGLPSSSPAESKTGGAQHGVQPPKKTRRTASTEDQPDLIPAK